MAGTEVLVVGGGGREEALRQALEASPEVDRALASPDSVAGLEQFTSVTKPFVVIGPEAPLVEGMADYLRDEGYVVFGAGGKAARYESDKAHAVRMMRANGIPHPDTVIALNPEQDMHYIRTHYPEDYAIKANGLAGGKGVVLPGSRDEAKTTVLAMREGTYDGAGKNVINFQARHHGPEVSAMVVVGSNDEHTILPLSQDHKRLEDGDKGPNTGGMGAYAPVPSSIVNAGQYRMIQDIARESLAGMRGERTPYERAVLYIGLMMSDELDGAPAVIEYNVRFGDPETQVLMPLLQAAGVDVYRLLRSAAEGDLEIPDVDFAHMTLSALSVCLASDRYPASKKTGDEIWGLDRSYPDVTVQEAAVKDGKTNGGRVLYVTGTGETVDMAAQRAYAAIDVDREGPDSGRIGFSAMQFRRDIGHLARVS